MLRISDSVVTLVDVQGRLAQAMHEKESLFRHLQILLQGTRLLGVPIIWLEQYPQGLGPTVPEIAQLLDGLEPIEKISFSGCGSDDYQQALRSSGASSVLLAGIESHVCVYQTARDLLVAGHHVEVVTDAVSSRTAANRAAGLQRMAAQGAGLMTTEMVLFELLREAGSAEFKAISRLVR